MADTMMQQMEHQPGGRVGRRGQRSETDWLSTITTGIKQQLLRICVQSRARLSIDRVEGLGGGAGLAARRRDQVRFTEYRMER